MEVFVILHTSNGNVTTAYKISKIDDAIAHFQSYIKDGKLATMTNVLN